MPKHRPADSSTAVAIYPSNFLSFCWAPSLNFEPTLPELGGFAIAGGVMFASAMLDCTNRKWTSNALCARGPAIHSQHFLYLFHPTWCEAKALASI
uniref:Uncharacterized protein n=1 Tax=Physcomitrium patens TaxID=3218 RepID=A0A2K1JYR6_PHYPA|nr:hypothetical protein PHYPA_013791 [Physcomitrium patens]